LNIDPTDEDSWTFGTNSGNTTSVGPHYQVFNENGGDGGDAINIEDTVDSLMCEDNCRLLLNTNVQGADNRVLTLQDNDDSILTQMNTTSNGGKITVSPNNATAFGVAEESAALGTGSQPVTITEQGPNSGVFGTYDESDVSVLKITTNAARGTSASIDYNETPVTILVGFDFASIDIQPIDDEWTSGEEIPVVVVDGDANKNSRADEDLDLDSTDVTLIPSLRTGDPITLAENNSTDGALLHAVVSHAAFSPYGGNLTENGQAATGDNVYIFDGVGVAGPAVNASATVAVDAFSKRGILTIDDPNRASIDKIRSIFIDLNMTGADVKSTFLDTSSDATDRLFGYNLLNVDLRGINSTASYDIYLLNATSGVVIQPYSTSMGYTGSNQVTAISIVNGSDAQALTLLNGTSADATGASAGNYTRLIDTIADLDDDDSIGLLITDSSALTSPGNLALGDLGIAYNTETAFVVDFFSFGFTDDGVQSSERVANQIIRIEAEESGDNTSTFEGSLEYVMVNQLNILDDTIYTGVSTLANDPSLIVI
jgi:hypothetical protein